MTDATLKDMLRLLDAQPKTQESRIIHAAVCDVLEERHPHLEALLLAWCGETGDLSDTRTYAQVALAGLEN